MVKERGEKSFMVKRTREEQQADHAAFEAKLQQAHAALRKAEAAQPTQGGYYCAAARTSAPSALRWASARRPSAGSTAAPASPHTSPNSLSQTSQRLATPKLSEASTSPPPSIRKADVQASPLSPNDLRVAKHGKDGQQSNGKDTSQQTSAKRKSKRRSSSS
jgi:hypothetical protein